MIKIAVCGLVCALVPSLGFADGFAINVLNTQYHTALTAHFCCDYSETLSKTASTPLHDAIEVDGLTWALANADLFAIEALTDGAFQTPIGNKLGQSTALAESTVYFTPVADGIGAVTIDVENGGRRTFAGGFVQILDLSTGDLMWRYDWLRLGGGTVPWIFNSAVWQVDTVFDVTHEYALTMSTNTDASSDDEHITMQVSGLEAVPEPASLLLIVLGTAGAARMRRRRERQ